MILDSKDDDLRKIRKRILDKKGSKAFRFSKANAIFLKTICEDVLKIEITEELVNNSINDALEPIKFMYNKKRAKKLKYLYEKIRSPSRIVEYLTDQGELIIPARTTISNHIKKYFKEIGKDIKNWKKKYPPLSIYYNKTLTRIDRFPVEKREILIEIIINLLNNCENEVLDFDLIKILEAKLVKSELLLMGWLVRSPKYSKAFKSYLKSLIDLIRQLVNISINNLELNINELKSDISYANLKDIMRFIRNNDLLEFNISPRSRLRSI